MAAVLRLENHDATTTLDLLNGNIGLERRSAGFKMDPNDPFSTTVILLNFNATTAAGVRADYNAMISLLDQARDWHRDNFESQSVWLRWQADGESAKRALIYDYSVAIKSAAGTDPFQLLGSRIQVSVSITHLSESEDATATPWDSGGYSQEAFRTMTLGETIAPVVGGDRGSRIQYIGLYPNTGYTVDKLWIGIKTVDTLTQADLIYVWDCLDATTFGQGIAGFVTVSGSSAVQVVKIDFNGGSGALAYRLAMTLSDFVPVNPQNMAGTYQILLRYKVDSSTDIALRGGISAGLSGGEASYNGLKYNLDNDGSWHWLELGAMRFPPRGIRAANIATSTSGTSVNIDGTTIWIDAERISGTGSLYLDCIQFIPYEHHMSIEGLKAQILTQATPVFIMTHENGIPEALTRLGLSSDDVYATGDITAINDWRLPDNSNYFLVATAVESLTAALRPGDGPFTFHAGSFYRRWSGYRE